MPESPIQNVLGELRSLASRGNHEADLLLRTFDLMRATQKRVYTARFASTANRASLSGLASTGLDGTPLEGNIVLLKDQTSALQNGLYKATSGTWSRVVDDNGDHVVNPGLVVTVTEGSTLADTQWEISSDAFVVDTDSIAFKQMGAGGATFKSGFQNMGNSGTVDLTKAVTNLKAGHSFSLLDGAAAVVEVYLRLAENGAATVTGNISFKGIALDLGNDSPSIVLTAASNGGATAYLRWSPTTHWWDIIWMSAPGGSFSWDQGSASS